MMLTGPIARLGSILVVFLASLSVAGPLSPPVPEGRDPALWALMSAYLEAMHERWPEAIGPQFGDERLNDRLGDVSAAAEEAWSVTVRSFLRDLESLPRVGFSEPDRLDAELLAFDLGRQLDAVPFHRWQMPVTAQNGPQVWLPQLGAQLPMSTEKHRRDYLQRLKQVPIVVGDTIDNMRMGMAVGRVPPRVAVAPAVEQALALAGAEIRADPSKSPFYAPFLGLDSADPVGAEAREVIAERIVPVYMELALFLQNEYLPACRETVGIARSIDGPAAYDLALAEHTTLPDATALAVHEIGLGEVARIRAEMMTVIGQTDWAGNERAWDSDDARFAAFIDHLRTDPRFYFTDPAELLNAYKVIAKTMDAGMPELFGRLPRLSYGVRPIPDFAAAAAPSAYYYPGSMAAGIAGYFMCNLSSLDQRPTYEMIALTLHESVPGHHHQIALAQELDDQHPLRSTYGFTAFVEGWGLYAESLGLEVGGPAGSNGLYADPYDNFGRLNFEMWRALRLVVDTGIHAFDWDRRRAVEYMTANSAISAHNIGSEVDRYIGWPGQATGYKMGQLRILALRRRAERALGERFNLRAFHDALLGAGALPIPLLEARMERWIESRSAEE